MSDPIEPASDLGRGEDLQRIANLEAARGQLEARLAEETRQHLESRRANEYEQADRDEWHRVALERGAELKQAKLDHTKEAEASWKIREERDAHKPATDEMVYECRYTPTTYFERRLAIRAEQERTRADGYAKQLSDMQRKAENRKRRISEVEGRLETQLAAERSEQKSAGYYTQRIAAADRLADEAELVKKTLLLGARGDVSPTGDMCRSVAAGLSSAERTYREAGA